MVTMSDESVVGKCLKVDDIYFTLSFRVQNGRYALNYVWKIPLFITLLGVSELHAWLQCRMNQLLGSV